MLTMEKFLVLKSFQTECLHVKMALYFQHREHTGLIAVQTLRRISRSHYTAKS